MLLKIIGVIIFLALIAIVFNWEWAGSVWYKFWMWAYRCFDRSHGGK